MKRVALFLNLGHHYAHRCLQGVRETVTHLDDQWIFHHLPPTPAGFARLQDWRPDGVLASAPERAIGHLLESLTIPLVHLGNRHVAPGLPHVGPDHRAIGRLAADHLHHLKLPTMAFIGWPGQSFSDARGLGFQERLTELGLPLLRHAGGSKPAPGQGDRPPDEAAMLAWIRSLPTPVGILVANDYLAWQVAELIRQAGLRIPEDIALLGADDDPLVGQLIHLPLSSVQVNAHRIGQEAATMLLRAMHGEPGPTLIEVQPAGVVTRTSTDLLQLDDPLVREAVSVIATDVGRSLTVEGVARRLKIPRRTLERRFTQVLGRTILAEIQRVRLDHAKILLTTTEASIAEIATRSGFGTPTHFAAFFKARTGFTPLRYREHNGH